MSTASEAGMSNVQNTEINIKMVETASQRLWCGTSLKVRANAPFNVNAPDFGRRGA